MKPRRLIGAICPVCRTVQDWEGEHIFTARIFCRGDEHVGAHDAAIVATVVPYLAHAPIRTLLEHPGVALDGMPALGGDDTAGGG